MAELHPRQSDREMLGKIVRYIGPFGIEQRGTLVGIVDEPSYIIARPWTDQDLVIAQSKVRNMEPIE